MEPEKKSNGAFIGLAIIIIILIIGGIYIWISNKKAAEKLKAEQSEAVIPEDTSSLNDPAADLSTPDTDLDFDADTVN